jgi:hypothetical protein
VRFYVVRPGKTCGQADRPEALKTSVMIEFLVSFHYFLARFVFEAGLACRGWVNGASVTDLWPPL